MTWGTYWQPTWFMTTGSLGAGQVLPAGRPFTTRTRTLAIVLPLPRTRASLGTVACFLAHMGSAATDSGFRVGALPS
ncbi:MAG: hypothetical protein A2V74_04765 [Acidobacteria bacterium RBG_16_70_10]|nr:MAG: hypothetical protein A2V74_04765 [Acidobacteria bacterium RBG_16_70_10]